MPLNSEGLPAGLPDWSFELTQSQPKDAEANAELEAAVGATMALRTELSTLQALASHDQRCVTLAYRSGVSLDNLANDLNLRPVQLKAVIEGQQPLIPKFWCPDGATLQVLNATSR